MTKKEEPHVRTDCSLHRYNKRFQRHDCSALKACYCATEECSFYRTDPIEPPDPLYSGPAPMQIHSERIPDEVVAMAAKMRHMGKPWAEIERKFGHKYNRTSIQNRITKDRHRGLLAGQ